MSLFVERLKPVSIFQAIISEIAWFTFNFFVFRIYFFFFFAKRKKTELQVNRASLIVGSCFLLVLLNWSEASLSLFVETFLGSMAHTCN